MHETLPSLKVQFPLGAGSKEGGEASAQGLNRWETSQATGPLSRALPCPGSETVTGRTVMPSARQLTGIKMWILRVTSYRSGQRERCEGSSPSKTSLVRQGQQDKPNEGLLASADVMDGPGKGRSSPSETPKGVLVQCLQETGSTTLWGCQAPKRAGRERCRQTDRETGGRNRERNILHLQARAHRSVTTSCHCPSCD